MSPSTRGGTMTAPTTMQIPGFRGDVIAPDHDGYDDARAVWNGTVDRRPRLIARCSGTADVAAAVRFARDRDLEIAVRGGGHNVAGTAVCDDGIVIDLSAMRAVTVDPVERTARVQGGALWGDVDHETQATRSGHHGRHRGPHRRRRPQLGRRHRLAHAQARAHRRQPRGSRGGHRRGRHHPGIGQRSPRPVLGAAGRRRELRRRQLVPVHVAPRRPHRHGRTGVLGGRGHHRRPALLP